VHRVCASLLSVLDPPEARKVSFLARPNMSSLMRPICMVDDECKVQIEEAAFSRFLRPLLHA
jgi:hypothetical protein